MYSADSIQHNHLSTGKIPTVYEEDASCIPEKIEAVKARSMNSMEEYFSCLPDYKDSFTCVAGCLTPLLFVNPILVGVAILDVSFSYYLYKNITVKVSVDK